MKKQLIGLVALVILLTACGTPEVITVIETVEVIKIIEVTATPEPTVSPTATPEFPVEVQVIECIYDDRTQIISVRGTITNNMSDAIVSLRVVVVLFHDNVMIHSDVLNIVSATTGGLTSGGTSVWSTFYFFRFQQALPPPFECEVSVMDFELVKEKKDG